MKKKFGDERKTKIVAAEGEIELEDLIKEEQVVIALTRFGYIKRAPIDTFKSQRRGGKGITGMTTRDEDFVKEIFTASTHDTILFFSNKGKMYRLRGFEIPEAGRTAKGTAKGTGTADRRRERKNRGRVQDHFFLLHGKDLQPHGGGGPVPRHPLRAGPVIGKHPRQQSLLRLHVGGGRKCL